ncbi:MAG: GNAT family N-acetyltransferase [Phenylobacterium sp.]|uniref:GNAT family N-acetyltransferase n=1 Tax=Phenylobacterium sp. TaxID=1871053 RepID=UPI001A5965BF|nr:GNAT family N-acetyltransferase [Phenylobacterium sp.]MBL8772716.1 GNAT family N-acetyltransferase [Phenylobacterium sp.]
MDDAGLSQGLTIRRARPEELAACAELYVRVLQETFTWLPKDRHRAEDFLAAAREEEVFVAVEDGRLLGLAALYRPQAFLHSLYVDARGRGVGKALLDYVIAAAGGRLQLKCQTANRGAQAFYLREGFRCTEAGEDGGVAWLRYVIG